MGNPGKLAQAARRTGLWAACALAATAFVVPAARAQDATAFQLNPGHTGSVAMPGFQPPLKLLWKKKIKGQGLSYPLIANGIVYVTIAHHAFNDYEGVDLYAVDAATGKTKWKRYIDNQIDFTADTWANATYDDGQVFVLDRYLVMTSYDGMTGRTKWSQLEGAYDAPDGASAPTAFDGTVYMQTAAASERKGLLRWGIGWGTPSTSPAIGDGGTYEAYPCSVFKYRLTDGVQLWQNGQNCGGGATTVQFLDNRLFIRDQGGQPNSILDSATGATLGTFPDIGRRNVVPAVYDDNGSRFMIAPSDNALVKYDVTNPASVTAVWSTSLNNEPMTSAPLVVNGYAIEGTTAGGLYVVSPQGQVAWSMNLGGSVAPFNENGGPVPTTGLGAGGGIIVVPTENDNRDAQNLFAFAPQ
ncbi:MAG: PQQ-binding-like beta-propeller repeat protein [Alphaproteobacteria bacterium]|nr:PQQ-binding-like beta-propeller repeat protein [Alphaproteobacteria bacterium]